MLATRPAIFVATVIGAGIASTAAAVFAWETGSPDRLFTFVIVLLLASSMKARIPGLNGALSSVSLGFVAVLVGVAMMTLTETVLGVALAGVAQTFWRPSRRPQTIQVAFNVSVLAASAWIAYTVANAVAPGSAALRVAAGVVPLYLFNAVPVAILLSLISTGGVRSIWDKFQFAVFPCYLAGAVSAAAFAEAELLTSGGDAILTAAGLAYMTFNSYRSWLRHLA
jgi:hypothetical protein